MAAAKTKLEDTPKKKVVITYRNEDNDTGSIRVGTNNVIENGERVLKQYRIKTGEPVELPVTVIEQLKARYEVRLNKDNQTVHAPLYYIEDAE